MLGLSGGFCGGFFCCFFRNNFLIVKDIEGKTSAPAEVNQNSFLQFLWKKYKVTDIVSHLPIADGESEDWRWEGWVKPA